MKSKIIKIEAVVLTIVLLGALFIAPVGSFKAHENKSNTEPIPGSGNTDNNALWIDTNYNWGSEPLIIGNDGNPDAGYRKDAREELNHALVIFPNEPVDNTSGRGRTGLGSSSDTADAYTFLVCEGQKISVGLFPPTTHDFDLCLYDENGQIAAFSTNPGYGVWDYILNHPVDGTGFWYIRINYVSGYSNGLYEFEVQINDQNDAGTGDDAGDSYSEATLITEDTYFGFLDMNDDSDWYKFSVDDGDFIHIMLDVENYMGRDGLSDADIYLYDPYENLVYSETKYLDDELYYPANEAGDWVAQIKLYPGYVDIPQPTEWYYYTYSSGVYEFTFSIEGSGPEPVGPVPQPEITPIAQTFKIQNDPDSNKDEYAYLASIPACNYLDNGIRYVSPIVYEGDDTPTNWFGTVDDTTQYLIDDWDAYLDTHGITADQYTVPDDPVEAAADIAINNWDSSDLAVVAVDGSDYEDNIKTVLQRTRTLKCKVEEVVVPCDEIEDTYPINLGGPTLFRTTVCAVELKIDGSPNKEFAFINEFPKLMDLNTKWWPELDKFIYCPVTWLGRYGFSAADYSGDWSFVARLIHGHRYSMLVTNTDSVLNVKVTTEDPSDLMVFLVDPKGNLRDPCPPDWNGGEINPRGQWNGFHGNGDELDYAFWEVEPHTEASAEVLHPERGIWRVIVVPRYAEGDSSYKYTVTGTIRKLNKDRINAAVSAANAAVIASQEHVPLLYVDADSVPAATSNAFDDLGVDKVIFVEKDKIGKNVRSKLPTIEEDLTTMQDIIDYIKDYESSENYITITSLKTGDGYFAPAAMLAAYHSSPVLRIGEAEGNPAAVAQRINTWRRWSGDYYHGNRAPGHLPIYNEPIEKNLTMFIDMIRYFISGGASGQLPPFGLDAKRYWNEELHDGIYNWINGYGLDLEGQEAYCFVAPRDDITINAHSVMMGNNSYAGHMPGDTPAFTSALVVRNVLYPALIFANPYRDITTSQLMNFPDVGNGYNSWTTNDGVTHYPIASSRNIKEAFTTHRRTYEGHCLWRAHLERMNQGSSVMYYSGHGTGGSGISAQYEQYDEAIYPDQIWWDAWRGYMYDNWEMPRENGFRWYNSEGNNIYEINHYKWVDELTENLKSNAIFYMSCSTAQQFGPMVYLEHGAVLWYGNAGSGSCPEADLQDDEFFKDSMIYGEPVGPAYSKQVWLHYRDFTTKDPTSMYGVSSLYGTEGITTVQCIYGDPSMIIYSPEWTNPVPVQL